LSPLKLILYFVLCFYRAWELDLSSAINH